MLNYLGEEAAAFKIEKALREVIFEARFVTYDLKESRDDPSAVGTLAMAQAMSEKIRSY